MPRGVPITAAQMEIAARVYAETGNAEEAARQAGAAPSAIRRRLSASREADRRRIHAHATQRGIREARKQVADAGRVIHRVLLTASSAESVEPKDLAQLANAIARLTETMVSVSDCENRRRSSALTRRKTLAEIKAIESGIQAGGDVIVHIAIEPTPSDTAVASDVATGTDTNRE